MWTRNEITGVVIFHSTEELPKCEICGHELPGSLTWDVANGVARCQCGANYVCYHRDEKGKVMEKEPTCCVPEELIPKYRVAWESSDSNQEFFRRATVISEEWDAEERRKKWTRRTKIAKTRKIMSSL